MLTKLERRIEELGENFNRVKKYNNQSELKNAITEIKNTLEVINS